MPAQNKTNNIQLNQWQNNEYPKMADFNEDNSKIDAAVKALNDDINKIKSGETVVENANKLGDHNSSHFATVTQLSQKLNVNVFTAQNILNLLSAVDGAGSGLDADKLDGHDSTHFATVSALNTKLSTDAFNAANILAKLLTVDGSNSELDADLLDGHEAEYFATATKAAENTSEIDLIKNGVTAAGNAAKLGGQLPAHYATAAAANQNASDITAIKNGTQAVGNANKLGGAIAYVNNNPNSIVKRDGSGNIKTASGVYFRNNDGIFFDDSTNKFYFTKDGTNHLALDFDNFPNRSNHASLDAEDFVVGQLAWNKYGNGHTIFDASKGITPSGTACDNFNPAIPWNPSKPTLLAFNGTETSGVRVDSAAFAESHSNGVGYIVNPRGGKMSHGNNKQGAIAIVLPHGWVNTMIKIRLSVYEYRNNRSFEVVLGGYLYAGVSSWINTFANYTGDRTLKTRFAFHSGKARIYVGEPSDVWHYPKIVITDVQIGHSSIETHLWHAGFEVGVVSAIYGSVSRIHPPDMGTVTIPASGWVNSGLASHPKMKEIPFAGMHSGYKIELTPLMSDSHERAFECGLEKTQTFDGYYRVYAKEIPTSNIMCDYEVRK